MATTYKPLKPGQEIIIGPESTYEYPASVLYSFPPYPDDMIRSRSIFVTEGDMLGIAHRFMKSGRIYVLLFTPTKQGTPRVRSRDRRHHTIGRMFDAGTDDATILDFVRDVMFEKVA